MDSCFGAAMVYVALSRIQSIHQLFLLSLDTTKIWADDDALEEMMIMKQQALNNEINLQLDPWFQSTIQGALKITSLNIFHLPSRLSDLQNDPTILMSDIICLQETFSVSMPLPSIHGYVCQMPPAINQGRGRGVAAFIREALMNMFLDATPINDEVVQCLKLSFQPFDVITVYKTQECTTEANYQKLVQLLLSIVDLEKPTVLNGDFNFDFWKEKENPLGLALKRVGFKQLVTLPTTIRGKCIDHVYINEKIQCVYEDNYQLYYPYFTDHEAVRVIIEIQQ